MPRKTKCPQKPRCAIIGIGGINSIGFWSSKRLVDSLRKALILTPPDKFKKNTDPTGLTPLDFQSKGHQQPTWIFLKCSKIITWENRKNKNLEEVVQAKGLVKFRKHGVSRPKIPASHITCPHVTIALSLPTPIPIASPWSCWFDPPSLIHHLLSLHTPLYSFFVFKPEFQSCFMFYPSFSAVKSPFSPLLS